MKRWPVCIFMGLLLTIYVAIFFNSYQFYLDDGQITYPLFDDGMISLEYGRNFSLTGNFFSGNQIDATVGFTSYFWVLSLALLAKLGFGVFKLPYVVVVWNIIILLAALWLTSRVLGDSSQSNDSSVKLVFWCISLSSPALLFWTLRGMEVPLAVLMLAIFINLAVLAKERKKGIFIFIFFAIAAFVTPFARPDQAPIVVAVAIILAAYRQYLSFFVILGGLSLGEFFYSQLNMALFGQPVSNSYFLKVAGTTTVERLERWISSLQMQLQHHSIYLMIFSVALVVALAIFPNVSNSRKVNGMLMYCLKNFRIQVILLVMGVGIVIWAYIGGDGWEAIPVLNRFLTALLPLLIVLVCLLLKNGIFGNKTIFIIGATLALNAYYAISMIGFDSYNDKKYSYLGYSIGKEFGSAVTVLNYWYGQPAYYAGVFATKSIDGLGKIDPVVAKTKPQLKFWPGHDRWNHSHSIGQLRPDLIVGMPCPKAHDPGFNCNAIWDEIVKYYQYQPHTAQEGYTVFVSPTASLPDLNLKIEEMNQRIASKFIKFRN